MEKTKKVRFISDPYLFIGGIMLSWGAEDGGLSYYLYDEMGLPIGLACRESTNAKPILEKYFFTKNLQGDIIGIVNEAGKLVVEYTYDAWGKCTETIHPTTDFYVAELNPFRYRGYYYDEESGYYYLNSRYYDPQTKRFLNSDDISVITATPEGLTDKNLYAYCDNNPIMRVDNDGNFWLTAIIGGALVGLVSQLVSDFITSAVDGELKFSSVSTYVGAAVGGAVGGLLGNTFLGNVAADATESVIGTVVGMVGENIESAIEGSEEYHTFEEISYYTIGNAMLSAFSVGTARISKIGQKLGPNSFLVNDVLGNIFPTMFNGYYNSDKLEFIRKNHAWN